MFKNSLYLKHSSDKKWRLTEPLTYLASDGKTITVPKGYKTDLDSIPRIPLIHAWLKGRAIKSAAIHDWLYDQQIGRKAADKTFLEAMRFEGVGKVAKGVMYAAVRLFGWLDYKKRSPSKSGH